VNCRLSLSKRCNKSLDRESREKAADGSTKHRDQQKLDGPFAAVRFPPIFVFWEMPDAKRMRQTPARQR
jgi:hypothetical protein